MANANFTETITEYKEDPIDQLTRLADQLSAMLIIITGTGFQTFNTYNDHIKENYLWACSDHASELKKISLELALGESSEVRN